MNTIYDGSFVLGQTSAENPSLLVNENSEGNVSILQGTVATSTGIVGDGSTQNPLRADETVLYKSTANPVTTVMPITLSEPISNFERIRVVGRNERSTNNYIPYKVWEYDTDSLAFSYIMCLDQIMPNNPINNWDAGIYCRVCCVDLSESGKMKPIHTDSYAITKAGAWARQSNDSWGETQIYKVIGINRIANN